MLGRRERVDGAGGVTRKERDGEGLGGGREERERERMWWETKKDSEIKNGAV